MRPFSRNKGAFFRRDPLAWDEDYLQGKWQRLGSTLESTRYAVLANWIDTYKCGDNILDVGCGDGNLLSALKTYSSYHGIDISSAAINLAHARSNDNVHFSVANAETFNPQSRYTAVVFNEVLYYLQDPLKVMKHLSKHKQDKGITVASCFVSNLPNSWVDSIFNEVRWHEIVTINNSIGTWICSVSQS